ncbi:MAG: hypothetical protein Q7R90_04220 [bacterium]|nr:hypothetical protein [bacterium]
MFGIHLGRAREKIIAVADIGSGSAALAIIAIPPGGPARLLVARRSILPLEERMPAAIVAAIGSHLLETGQQVLAEYHKQGGRQPESVYAVIRAPWTQSKTIGARITFPKPTKVTGAMISKLAQQAMADEKEFKTGILEAGIIRVEVNGYPTGKPEGKPCRELSVTALLSVCDSALRESTTGALQQLFGARRITMRSGVHAILSVMRDTPDVPEDFLVVDMASEGTNFMVVRDSVTTDHGTYTEGKNTILKRISADGMMDSTLTLLRLIARGECHDPACEALNVTMAKAEPELVRVFGEVIAKLVSRRRLPNRLILATHEDLAPWLTTLFSRIDFAQFTTTTQPFSVRALKPVDLAHRVLPEGNVRTDTGMLIASALVHIEEDRA